MCVHNLLGRGKGLRVKIGHHKIGACAEIGQNRIRGGWGVKKTQKTSDIIHVRSLTAKMQCGAKFYQKLNLHTAFCLQRQSKFLHRQANNDQKKEYIPSKNTQRCV